MMEFQLRLDRLQKTLEGSDPRTEISAYHDMPYAIFRYDPAEEFALRKAVTLLTTRLQNRSKRVTRIFLSECLMEGIVSQRALEEWFQVERDTGTAEVIQTIANVLEEFRPLVDMVSERLPRDPDPLTDVVFITRTGALFPVYRTFSLLEQLKGHVSVPTVLFYPGDLDGAAGLRFMGVLDAEHNYRPKIF
jgi:hypothetical protein